MIVDVIIPVYNGLKELRACLESVFDYPQQTPFDVVIIDDASTDEAVNHYLRKTAQSEDRLTLIRNPHNQGFVASVNRGMALNPDRDVLLLNSDACVANDWLDRLHRCAYHTHRVGTVSPFSNNATICSFPRFCEENPLPDGWSLPELDQIFARANPCEAIEIPTALGFCMYIRRDCLNDIGYFDADQFGLGYGEENDFCMRAAARGWRHMLCADTFVFHAGAVSFKAEKEKRLSRAMIKLEEMYPDYHQLIRAHIVRNPARHLRVNAILHMMRQSPKETVLFINHNMGGGTEKHVQELSACFGAKMNALAIRAMPEDQVRLSLGAEEEVESIVFQLPVEYPHLLKVLRFIGVNRVHFHHTMGIETRLWRLSQDLGIPMDVTLHDYYFINANPTLVGKDAKFCEDRLTRDERCKEAYPIPGGVTAKQWRGYQTFLLEAAERVIAPSQYAAEIYKTYFPDITLLHAYHPDWEQQAPYPPPEPRPLNADEPLRILVLGALSREKGADLLEACAKIARAQGLALEFHLLGYAYRTLDEAVIEHGAYHDEGLPELIETIRPHLAWFPARWPETYSYTLSAVLQAALPVAVPDLGSFPERLVGRPLTWILSWKQSPREWLNSFQEIVSRLSTPFDHSTALKWDEQPQKKQGMFSYQTDYLMVDPKLESFHEDARSEDLSLDWIKRLLKIELSKRERLLVHLLRIKESRLISLAMQVIPYGVQRAIKRKLSTRPIQEFLLQDESLHIR